MTIRKSSNNRKEIVQNKTNTIKKNMCSRQPAGRSSSSCLQWQHCCFFLSRLSITSCWSNMCLCSGPNGCTAQQLYRKRKEDPKGLFGSSCTLRNKQANKPEKKIKLNWKKIKQKSRKRNSPTFVSSGLVGAPPRQPPPGPWPPAFS